MANSGRSSLDPVAEDAQLIDLGGKVARILLCQLDPPIPPLLQALVISDLPRAL